MSQQASKPAAAPAACAPSCTHSERGCENPGRDVFIVSCVRTPIARGRKDGALHNIHPVDLLAQVLADCVDRVGVSRDKVEDVVCGCVTPVQEQGANIPRLAALKAGFPNSCAGVQINRMCGSSQQAIHFASQAIASGDMEMAVACGVEMMSVVPMGSDTNLMEKPELMASFPFRLIHQGQSAELVAEKYGITRAQCDAFAAESHEKAARARQQGFHDSEILELTVTDDQNNKKTFAIDEGVRVPVDRARMAKLPTVFKQGDSAVVTAGNASQISDGAAAVLLVSGRMCDELRLPKRARIVARVTVGSDPVLMLDGVIPATQKVLAKAGLTVADISCFEVNEAFASVVLSWMKEIKPDPRKVNPNGGAIAHGHPLGASGCALMTKLVHELERSGGRYGLQTMCIGHGMATATIIENMAYIRPRL